MSLLEKNLTELVFGGVTVVERYLSRKACNALSDEIRCMVLTDAPTEVYGKPVTQEFQRAHINRAGNAFAVSRSAISQLESDIRTWIPHLRRRFRFNNTVAQRYSTTHSGIKFHRDGSHYGGVVANMIVEGRGEFVVEGDEDPDRGQVVEHTAGDVILMAAHGLGTWKNTPRHAIRKISEERLILGLRWHMYDDNDKW